MRWWMALCGPRLGHHDLPRGLTVAYLVLVDARSGSDTHRMRRRTARFERLSVAARGVP
ncbi:hypothetical protein [Mycolicibacterium mengxianglii]|uniref:hypothetical protein n=1 Tax=Mycolicibacterium mengxianglii TaxID=2736649 RepID=UPI0018EEF03C|nr:hypothetical protein [Mycolicibacterium mengxianglii]